MHEAAIAQSILKIASGKLKQTKRATALSAVRVVIGSFRNVEVESLQFAFDNLKELFEGCDDCKLDAQLVLAKAICQNGEHSYQPAFENSFRCPICSAGMGKLLCGEELDITKLTFKTNVQEECCNHA